MAKITAATTNPKAAATPAGTKPDDASATAGDVPPNDDVAAADASDVPAAGGGADVAAATPDDDKKPDDDATEGWESLEEDAERSLAPNPELEEAMREAMEAVEAREEERRGPAEGEDGDLQDRILRLQAEFENYRKAVAKREADAKERANEHLVVEILPVLDACDGALASGATDVEPVRSALVDALTKQGLERIDGQDTPFDPACHDAVMHEPDEEGEGPVVAEVMRAGYSWKGRVVRPAMVKVRG